MLTIHAAIRTSAGPLAGEVASATVNPVARALPRQPLLSVAADGHIGSAQASTDLIAPLLGHTAPSSPGPDP